MAISLMVEINRTFGTKLPVSMLLREPTIRRFARRLRSHTFVSSSFVALSISGRKPPLFVAANNYRTRDLVDALGPDQPLYQIDAYALQEERLISDKPLFSTVQEMAIHFVSQIIAVQDSGPYFATLGHKALAPKVRCIRARAGRPWESGDRIDGAAKLAQHCRSISDNHGGE